jgi:hypothetical protein
MQESSNALEQEIIIEKDSIQSFDSLIKSFSTIKTDSEKANTFFIKRDEVVNFLDSIESLASTTRTQISTQSVSEKKSTTNSNLLSVVVNARGSYSSLHYLIRILEELPYQTEIQNVRLSNNGGGEGQEQSGGSWSADITIVGVMF